MADEVKTESKKRKLVEDSIFVNAVFDEAAAGGSCESLAPKLDMAPHSIYQRINKLNARLLEAGQPEIPTLRVKQERKPRAKRFNLDVVLAVAEKRREAAKALEQVDGETQS